MTLRTRALGLGAFIVLAACDDGADGASDAAPPVPDAAIVDAATPGASQGSMDAAGDAAPSVDAAQSVAEAGVDAATSDAAGGDAGTNLPGWKLIWNDEFDGPANTKLDASRWVYETGGNGFGNNQLEFDTDRAENASLDGSGELVISAIKESYMGRSYTSARLKTQGKFEHGYGRYEARMRIPFGQGIWPAFWMLGADIGSAGWPSCGEIDIMENIGREPSRVHGTLHGPGYSGENGIGAPRDLPNDARYADAYHVFAVEWEEGVVRWYVDGELYQTRRPSDLPSGGRWVYDHPHFILLNLAVGGQWPGEPDSSTTFPQTLRVDYVRVYDRAP